MYFDRKLTFVFHFTQLDELNFCGLLQYMEFSVHVFFNKLNIVGMFTVVRTKYVMHSQVLHEIAVQLK